MNNGIRQHRELPDLLDMVAQLQKRVQVLETARRLGNTSLDGGELSIRGGDIVVRATSGNPVIRLEHSGQPTMRFYPEGVNNFEGRLFGWESGDSGAVLELNMQQGGNVQDGGKVLLMNKGAVLSYQPNGAPEVFLWLAPDAAHQEHIRFRGRWIVGEQFDSQDALVMGIENVGAGFGAASFNFPTAFDTAPFMMYSIFSAVGPVSHNLTAVSASGFTVGWSGTTAKTIYWQAWRQ